MEELNTWCCSRATDVIGFHATIGARVEPIVTHAIIWRFDTIEERRAEPILRPSPSNSRSLHESWRPHMCYLTRPPRRSRVYLHHDMLSTPYMLEKAVITKLWFYVSHGIGVPTRCDFFFFSLLLDESFFFFFFLRLGMKITHVKSVLHGNLAFGLVLFFPFSPIFFGKIHMVWNMMLKCCATFQLLSLFFFLL